MDQRGLQDLFPGRRRGYEYRRAPTPRGARADLDWNGLAEAVRLAVRFLDNAIDVGAPRHPLRDHRLASVRSRRIGLGILGMADCFVMLGMAEEDGAAYKDIDEVIDATERAGISRRVAKLSPVGNVKG